MTEEQIALLAELHVPTYVDGMHPDERRNGTRQMIADLRLLATNDGCIAAAWAVCYLTQVVADHEAKVVCDDHINEQSLADHGWEWRGTCWHYSLSGKRELLASFVGTRLDVMVRNTAVIHFVKLGAYSTQGELSRLVEALKGGAK